MAFVTLSFRKNDPLQLSIQLNYSTENTVHQHSIQQSVDCRVGCSDLVLLPRESVGSIGKARAFVTLSFRKNDQLQLSIQLNYSTEITSAQHTAECRLQSRV